MMCVLDVVEGFDAPNIYAYECILFVWGVCNMVKVSVIFIANTCNVTKPKKQQ